MSNQKVTPATGSQAERREIIRSMLRAWEGQTGNKVLLAVEGGSRGHGFAAPGSDHDVKIIYQEPMRIALSLFKRPEAFDLKRKDLPFRPDFDMEMSGWNAQTALKLAIASNPLVVEYCRKREIGAMGLYHADERFQRDLLMISRMMSPRPAFHNLRGIAKTNLHREIAAHQAPKQKLYLQTAQAIMRALWIYDHPDTGWDFPLNFIDLMKAAPIEPDVKRRLDEILKDRLGNPDHLERVRHPVLDAWVADIVDRLDSMAAALPHRFIDPEVVDRIWLSHCLGQDPAAEHVAAIEPGTGYSSPAFA